MSEENSTSDKPQAARARPYLQLLLLIPSAVIFAIGLWAYLNVEPGGMVDSIRLATKPGPVGQASEALSLITSTPSFYLKIKTIVGTFQTQPFDDKPIGNGLVWPLDRRYKLADVQDVEVWDHRRILHDKNLDHMSLDGQWSADGQTFHVDLNGRRNEPPKWAIPTLAVGATLCALVILRFVWDQVV